MTFSFKNKVAIITGGEMGIGKETALLLCEQGAKVIIAGINDEQGKITQSIFPESMEFVHTDVTDYSSVENCLRIAEKKFGPVNVLVNCAGIHVAGDITETTEKTWLKIMQVNVTGTFNSCKACISSMKAHNGGSIVNVSSEAGLVAIPGQVAYNTSKSAIIGLTKSIAIDHAKHHIRANAVCPGTTYTPLVEKALQISENPSEKLKELESSRPANRLGTPREIASAIIAIASDDIAYATGSIFSVDGGLTAQ
jgi:NAD(P)-dependent dehydrogenase (short-subunit alcohol dehydrogenase family)